jgi:hypothetical protein
MQPPCHVARIVMQTACSQLGSGMHLFAAGRGCAQGAARCSLPCSCYTYMLTASRPLQAWSSLLQVGDVLKVLLHAAVPVA